jgi:hypothetical protein
MGANLASALVEACMPDEIVPDDPAEREPAEGSRDTVNANLDDEGARERYRETTAHERERAGGITNRRLDEEIENQREVPPRGTTKEPEDHQ